MTGTGTFLRRLALGLSAVVPFRLGAEVSFTGLDEVQEQNARALMSMASAPCDVTEWRLRRLYRNADGELQRALEALGYYSYQLQKALTVPSEGCWQARFDLTLGEPVVIRSVDVSFLGDAMNDTLVTTVAGQLTTGSIVNHGEYERWKRAITTALHNRGYFDYEIVDNQVTIDSDLRHADVKLTIESGRRYRFGDVTFEPPILEPDLLAGYVRFRRGDPFDARQISKLHERLNASGYFETVTIRAEPAAAEDHEIPVQVRLSAGKRRAFTFGAGYATDTGIQGRMGYVNRRLNERGHLFNTHLFLSRVDSELTGSYRWPRGRPDEEWMGFYGGFLRKRTDTSESDKVNLGIRLARNRTENWLESPYLNVTHEDFLIGDQPGSSTLVIPGIRWESSVGRTLGRIPSGWRLGFELRGAHDDLMSDTSFIQGQASGKWITMAGHATRLLGRIDFGATAMRDLDELPATVRFFAGGDTSVRGYDFESIGPEDAQGNVTGGAHLIAASFEADWLVYQDWAIAAFADTGSAFTGTSTDFKTGVGIGVRWFSPVGPIRLDIAHPFDDPDTSFRIHITLGPDL